MIEMEAKVRIANPEEISKKLHSFYAYKFSYQKEDTYYRCVDNLIANQNTNQGINQNTNQDTRQLEKRYRIRNDGKNHIITAKRQSLVDGLEVNDEYEFVIESVCVDEFILFMSKIGFREYYKKTKIGEKFTHENFTLELSNILNQDKSIGYYLEIEYVSEELSDESSQNVRNKIMEIIEKLELSQANIEHKSYSQLILESNQFL